MDGYILAVDQGTSSTKSLVFSPGGEALATGSAVLRTDYSPDGKAEQDPDEIFRSVLDSVKTCIEALETHHSISRRAISCVGIANQRETFVLWDQEGRPLYPVVVWQCKRSIEICTKLKQAGIEDEIRTRTGLIVDPYFSGTKLLWLLRNVPVVKRAHDRGEVNFGTVDSWLLYRLTHGAVHATDHSNACRTMLFNIDTLEWDPELTAMLEMPDIHLPEIHPSAHRYGESDFDGLFERPIPITSLIGDSHASLFGERCFSPGSTKATLGTGTSILLNAGETRPETCPSAMTTIGYTIPDRCVYALEGIIVSAGSILTWLQDKLGLFEDPAVLESMALDVESSAGVCVIPGHAGLGAPFWKMDARGALTGLTFGTDRRHIVRAALECIPFQIKAILDAVAEESGVRCGSLRIDGGISRSDFVMQWAADTLGVPVHSFEIVDITALGAALTAAMGAGFYSGLDEIAALPLSEAVQTPGAGATNATEAYGRWRRVIDSTIAVDEG